MRHWLMKSEPEEFSIDDLERVKRAGWEGVRNYQARNYMRDDMRIGDISLFYHSSADVIGVAGLSRVATAPKPDPTAFDRKSPYFDGKSDPKNPRWMMVDVEFVERFPRVVTLDELRNEPRLNGLLVLRRGMRLSIQPVEKAHYDIILGMARKARP